MGNIVYLSVILMWLGIVLCNAVTALPISEDERYFEKQLNPELINNWLSSVRNSQNLNKSPCRYYAENSWTGPMPKRNSELINSLLSLPKNMNDAGK
ncbi:protein PDF-like [Haematobia irritans]|uniref:protein PDF-like n=1 Tax=Haematobia irritans TaxID=7368 RepID=UPI003F4FA061